MKTSSMCKEKKLGMLKILKVSKGLVDSPRKVEEDRFGDKLWRVFLRTLLRSLPYILPGHKSQRVFKQSFFAFFKWLAYYKSMDISTRKINESDIIIFNTLACRVCKYSRYESESKISSMLRNVTLFSNKSKCFLFFYFYAPFCQNDRNSFGF